MMEKPEVFVVFPSADDDKAKYAATRWNLRGYRVAVALDGQPTRERIQYFGGSVEQFFFLKQYKGYWAATNHVIKALMGDEKIKADIFVLAADDIDPDPTHTPKDISTSFFNRFPDGFGVMQPCGDPQGIDSSGKPAAARICGSPWLGREWCRRAYGGSGAMSSDYFHFYSDEELFEVATKLGVLSMRPDYQQFHKHWSWGHGKQTSYQKKNSEGHWEKDKATFMKRKALGFPGSEPLPV